MDQNEYSIRKHVKEYVQNHKPREPYLSKAKIRHDKMSNFIHGFGGLSVNEFARLCAVIGWKIIDEKGITIIGNPEKEHDEVSQNLNP